MTEQDGVEFSGERLDALLERIALPGQANLRALIAAGLGDSPCDLTVIGNAKHNPALATHQPCPVRHRTLIAAGKMKAPYGIGGLMLQALGA